MIANEVIGLFTINRAMPTLEFVYYSREANADPGLDARVL